MGDPSQARRYLTRYQSETAIELGQELRFDFGGKVSIVVRDQITRDHQGIATRFAFSIDAFCEALNVDDALEKTNVLVEGVVSTIAFSLSAVVNPCMLVKVIDVSPGSGDRELVQRIPLTAVIYPRRRFRGEVFAAVRQHLYQIPAEAQGRIYRALRWYRKALFETDPLDRFVNLWTGLEVINEMVKEKHELPKEQSVRKCDICGNDVVTAPTLAGVEFLIILDDVDGKEKWRKCNRFRQKFLHGHGSIPELLKEADDLIAVLQGALVRGIIDLIDLPIAQHPSVVRTPLGNVRSPYLRTSVILHGLNGEDITSGRADPWLELEETLPSTSLGESDVRHATGTINLTLRGHEGTWTSQWIEIVGEKDPEDKMAAISISEPTPIRRGGGNVG